MIPAHDLVAKANLALETAWNHFHEAETDQEIDLAIAEINAAEQRLALLRADCFVPARFPGFGRLEMPWKQTKGELRCAG